MKARFQIFKAPFYFVGWLAPAYGKDKVNPNGITKSLSRYDLTTVTDVKAFL